MKTMNTCSIPHVPDATYKRFLRFPPARPLEGAMAEAADWAQDWYGQHGRPWIVHTPVKIEVEEPQQLRVNGLPMGGSRVARLFHQATGGELILACAGIEAEEEAQRLWDAGEPDSYYFLEAYAAAVVESLLLRRRRELNEQEADTSWTAHACPGHGNWSILDNLKLIKIARQALELPAEVDVLESGMLRPKKSLLGLMGCIKEEIRE